MASHVGPVLLSKELDAETAWDRVALHFGRQRGKPIDSSEFEAKQDEPATTLRGMGFVQ